MYKCFNCGCEFEEPYYVLAGWFYGVGARNNDPQIAVCPNCEMDEFEEVLEDDDSEFIWVEVSPGKWSEMTEEEHELFLKGIDKND